MNSPYSASTGARRPAAFVCGCCQRPWNECVTDAGRSDGRDRQRTCGQCHTHAGNTMMANRDHIEMWRALVSKRNAAVARLQEQVHDLDQELRDRPEKMVDRYIDLDQLQNAQDQADRAFKSRENAWKTLCMVRLLHREGQPGQCRCGQPLNRCKTAELVDRYPGLEKWEKEQVRRFRDHLDHNLPSGHPALIDPRWELRD
jgi:hypothetical protein